MSTAPRMAPTFSAVPDSLSELDQWVVWRYMTRDGRQTKVPYSVTTGRPASSTDPATWCSFDRALDAFRNGNYVGIGFVFSPEDPYIGIDLDDCLDAGVPKRWAQPILERFADTYAEISPSGNGVKIWARGKVPADSGKKWEFEDGGVEMYDHARYFTVTGRPATGAPSQVEEHQTDIEWLYGILEGRGESNVVAFPKPKLDLTATPTIAGGDRHNTLLSFGARLRNQGMEPDEIFAALAALNQQRCSPPKSLDEVRRIAEWVGQKPPGRVPRALTAPPPPQPETTQVLVPEYAGNSMWREYLITGNSGPKPLLANAITGLRDSPEWAGALAYDEFSDRVTVRREVFGIQPGTRWCDHHDRIATEWLQRQGIPVSIQTVYEAATRVAFENGFHPVREWLNGLRWDGEPRIDHWLTTFAGVENTEYVRAVGARWMISAIARVIQPGCKSDCALILEGEQGAKKSTALRILGGQWFTDEIADLGSKDAAMQMRGAWIIEIAELDSMGRIEVSRTKSFLSRSVDRYRPSYGRTVIDVPRQCVFAGTTNTSLWNRDETGARRFWPARVAGLIRVDELERDRDQLWAEAYARYQDGCIWWLDEQHLIREAREEQVDRYESDPWQSVISEWIDDPQNMLPDKLNTAFVLSQMIRKDRQHWTQQDRNRVGRCLRSLGYERERLQDSGAREYRWVLSGEGSTLK